MKDRIVAATRRCATPITKLVPIRTLEAFLQLAKPARAVKIGYRILLSRSPIQDTGIKLTLQENAKVVAIPPTAGTRRVSNSSLTLQRPQNDSRRVIYTNKIESSTVFGGRILTLQYRLQLTDSPHGDPRDGLPGFA
ncbi:hypothetical protein HYFRA_00009284 [Hymenoscyphus fraxineus]|uniref:Uncharacterized protein n=1 Tax=Hymenoscyphus fraxineus TaxID=746836 RepID=A0A9N9PVU6_9HELO|nr:hypothetical protein HYFRA_00009284 [Hymenoscyphus fraxineus]